MHERVRVPENADIDTKKRGIQSDARRLDRGRQAVDIGQKLQPLLMGQLGECLRIRIATQ